MALGVFRQPWLAADGGTDWVRADCAHDLLVVTGVALRLLSLGRALEAEIVGFVEDRARVVEQRRGNSAIPLHRKLRCVCYILKQRRLSCLQIGLQALRRYVRRRLILLYLLALLTKRYYLADALLLLEAAFQRPQLLLDFLRLLWLLEACARCLYELIDLDL